MTVDIIKPRVSYEDNLISYLETFRADVLDTKKVPYKAGVDSADLGLDLFKKFELNSLIKELTDSNFDYAPYELRKFMKVDMTEFETEVLIIGAGGVTSWFLPQLIKLYYNFLIKRNANALPEHQQSVNIVLVDGDICETKNLLRQNFIPEDVNSNKAKVLSERYSNIYENVKVSYIDKYMYSKDFFEKIVKEDPPAEFLNEDMYFNIDSFTYKSGRTVINLVDNELTKHMIDFFLYNSFMRLTSLRLNRYFSVGCDVYNGTVYTTVLRGKTYSEDFRETSFVIDDGSIHQESCAEIAETQTVEQTFDSNTMGANILATLYSNFLANPLNFETSKVDYTSTAQPQITSTRNEYLDEFKLNIIYTSVYRLLVTPYLNRWGTFRKTPLGNYYERVDTFLKEYMDIV